MTTASIILAAGMGTRMHSRLPKVLHPIAGKPMIWYALQAVQNLVDLPPILVIGYGAEEVRDAIGDRADYALQEEQLGTGHAVASARSLLAGKVDTVLVTYSDMPLLRHTSLKQLLDLHHQSDGPVTMTSYIGEEARGFGRVLRADSGNILGIVEQAAATPEHLVIREYNVGAYCFSAEWLFSALERIPISPKGEYYLTDSIGLAVADGHTVHSLLLEDETEAIGVNNRVHLATVEKVLRRRINEQWMLAGVTIVDPERTYIQADVKIGQDAVIHPNTHLQGDTVIGEDGEIGPDTTVVNTQIGDRARITASVLEDAVVEDDVTIGPYCHLRKGAHLKTGVHLGNFCEVKQSVLGPGTKMGHFSYIGDAKIGEDVNIGAGTITCNFDGEKKNPTEIGDKVCLGSDTMLVAPVKIGDRSATGAGTVVTRDVPPDTLVLGVPAREKRKMEKSD